MGWGRCSSAGLLSGDNRRAGMGGRRCAPLAPVAQWTRRVNGGPNTQQSHPPPHTLCSSRVPCRALLLWQAQSHPPVSPTPALGKPLKSRACTLISVTLALGGGTCGASESNWA